MLRISDYTIILLLPSRGMAKFLCGTENSMLEQRPYTDAEFKATIRKQKKSGFLCSMAKLSKNKDTHCPPVNDTEAWIKYLNLTYRTPADCRRITAKRNKVRDYENKLFGKSTQCAAKQCSPEIKMEAAANKKRSRKLKTKCGATSLTRRFFKCAGSIDRSEYVAAAQATLACKRKHCKKELAATMKYLRQ